MKKQGNMPPPKAYNSSITISKHNVKWLKFRNLLLKMIRELDTGGSSL
jgi:hypothetical protein